MATNEHHLEMIKTMTGGMVAPQEKFIRSKRFDSNGKPYGEFRDSLKTISDFKNFFSVFKSLFLPVLIISLTVKIDHYLVWISGFLIMGLLQNYLFILHHEASHRLLFSNKKINDFIGINIIGWLTFGTGNHGYRITHMRHHRDEFGPKEPDFILYSFYPISKSSLFKKLLRDSMGISAFRILKPRFQDLKNLKKLKSTLSFLSGQIFLILCFGLFTSFKTYIFLWFLPWACIYQILNRLRAISEHGGMTRSSDKRKTTHHIRQNWLTNVLITPYKTGFHLAHHIDMSIPWRNLPIMHKALLEDGYLKENQVWPNYRSLWLALSSP